MTTSTVNSERASRGHEADETLGIEGIEVTLNACGSSIPSMLTLLYLAQQPRGFTAAEIAHYLGTTPDAALGSLSDAGLIFTTGRRAGTRYAINEAGKTWGVPLCASLLDTELTGNQSVGTVLGGQPDGPFAGSAYLRMRVLQHVHENPTKPKNMQTLRKSLSGNPTSAAQTTQALIQDSIVRELHAYSIADRLIQLRLPSIRQLNKAADGGLTPQQTAFYAAIAELHKSRQMRQTDGESLLNTLCATLRLPRQTVLRLAREAIGNDVLAFTDSKLFTDQARLDIAPSFRQVVGDIVDRTNAVRHSATYRNIASDYGARLMANPAAVAYLVAKTQDNSHEAQPTLRQMRQRLLGWQSIQVLFTLSPRWQERAACSGIDTNAFFKSYGGRDMDPMVLAAVLSYCRTCPVTNECLQWALQTPEDYGIWGGRTAEERKNLPLAVQALARLYRFAPR